MLKGNLSEFPLGTLIQTLAAAGRSGALLITPPWIEGRVILSDGVLYAAQAGQKSGWHAMELLVGLRDAPFVFDSGAEMPDSGNINVSLETALARLLSVADRWKGFTHIPTDWSLSVRLARRSGELKLTPAMLQVLGLVEDNSIARILELATTSPLDTAEALDNLLADGVLQLKTSASTRSETLVALSFYGNETGVAYLDEELYQKWLQNFTAPFLVQVRSPRGFESKFEAKPRGGIAGRIMLNDKDLRRIRAARGIKLQVRPELRNGAE